MTSDGELFEAFTTIFRAVKADSFLRATLGSGEEIADPFTVPGYPERVYCLSTNGTKVAAISNGISLVRNAPVLLEPVPTQLGEELWQVANYDPEKVRDFFGVLAQKVMAGYGGLGYGNDDYVESARFLPGLVSLVSGLTFRANPFFYRVGATRKFYDGSSTITISPPTNTAKTRWTLIGVDAATNTLTAVDGAEYSVTVPIGGAELSAITFTGIPLMGIKLNTGDTTVTGLDRYKDSREWLQDTADLIAAALADAVILAPTTTARNLITGTAVGAINLILKLFTGQTADYIQGRDASDAVIWKIDKNGVFSATSIQNTAIGTTTPASGFFSALRLKIGGFFGIFTHANTTDRTYTFPDKSGTVAMLDDVAAAENLADEAFYLAW